MKLWVLFAISSRLKLKGMTLQLNVVIFCTDHSAPGGSTEIPIENWVKPVSKQAILDSFADCGPDVKKLLSLLGPCSRWCIHAVDPPLTSYVKGHIALVGDSAHGMTPHLGSGISQGLEDALIICRLLTHPKTGTLNISVGVLNPHIHSHVEHLCAGST